MNEFSSKFSDFFKKEIIFFISLILAIISCFVKPTLNYSTYINWDTIILLFVIMLIVEILRNLSIFEILVRKLLVKVKNTRYLVLFLVFTCFFSSIFITNDVSLIIFVPFAILALRKVDRSGASYRSAPQYCDVYGIQDSIRIVFPAAPAIYYCICCISGCSVIICT